jgi:uncharacterized alpha-E superfamily protein
MNSNPVGVEEPSMLLSRVASSCFWLSRYRERAEFTARVLDVHMITQLDTRSTDDNRDWLPILQINGCLNRVLKENRISDKAFILHCLCLELQNPNSIMACVRSARENSRQAREQISSEMWEQVNTMYHELNRLTPGALLIDIHPILQRVKNDALLLQGLTDQTMMHGEAWNFIRLGRFMERANTTCRLLRIRASQQENLDQIYPEAMYWIAVLKSASSLEAFHKTYTAPVSATAATEFLLLNVESPRSILFCLENALEALNAISGTTGRRFNNEADRVLGQMASRLHYLRLHDIDLLSFLDELQACLHQVSDLVMQTYCSYEVA